MHKAAPYGQVHQTLPQLLQGCVGGRISPRGGRRPGTTRGGWRGVPGGPGSPQSWEACGGGDLGGLGARVGDSRRSSGLGSHRGGGSQERQWHSERGVRRVGGVPGGRVALRGGQTGRRRGEAGRAQPLPARLEQEFSSPGRRQDAAPGAALSGDARSERGLGEGRGRRGMWWAGPHCPLTGPEESRQDPPLAPAGPQPGPSLCARSWRPGLRALGEPTRSPPRCTCETRPADSGPPSRSLRGPLALLECPIRWVPL